MRVVSVVSTKGGVGKTTVAANLGGLLADAGLRVLLLDLDGQPTLSSYYALSQKAVAGAYELIAFNLTMPAQIVSKTVIAGLDLIISNDAQGQLSTLLLHAPDGRLRLRNLLDDFRPRYDLLVIDARLIDVFAHRVAKDIVDAVETIEPKKHHRPLFVGAPGQENRRSQTVAG
jgi:chromosome partitioning related protein ParA